MCIDVNPRLVEPQNAYVPVLMPALNVDERTEMLGGMHAGAPPEVFELFRSTAEASLPPV